MRRIKIIADGILTSPASGLKMGAHLSFVGIANVGRKHWISAQNPLALIEIIAVAKAENPHDIVRKITVLPQSLI